MSKQKLHFADNGNKCSITLYTGEAWSDEKKEIHDTFEVDVNELPATFTAGDEVMSLAQYGLKKILQDRTSDEKDKAVKFKGMQAVYEQLKSGVWRVAAEKGETSPRKSTSVDPILVEALVRVTAEKGEPKSHLQISTLLQSKTKEERKAMAEHPTVKAHYDAAKAEAEEAVEITL